MISATITPKAAALFKRQIAEYERKIGKTERDAMIDLGKSSSKELAIKVQPFGVSGKAGKKYEGSIRKQVHRALMNANIYGGSESASEAHQSRRNSRGQISNMLPSRGFKFKRKPIDLDERYQLAKKKALNAGLSKGAWIDAGESLDGKKISGIPKWIRRHVKHGSSKIDQTTSGIVIYLTNQISFIVSAMSDSDIKMALTTAYRKNIKRMQTALNKVK
jgi:hypothetical protein